MFWFMKLACSVVSMLLGRCFDDVQVNAEYYVVWSGFASIFQFRL